MRLAFRRSIILSASGEADAYLRICEWLLFAFAVDELFAANRLDLCIDSSGF